MPTPLAEGQENSFAPQMIFLWPPARGVGKKAQTVNFSVFTMCGRELPAEKAYF